MAFGPWSMGFKLLAIGLWLLVFGLFALSFEPLTHSVIDTQHKKD